MATTIHEACRDGDIETVRKLASDSSSIVERMTRINGGQFFTRVLCQHADVVLRGNTEFFLVE